MAQRQANLVSQASPYENNIGIRRGWPGPRVAPAVECVEPEEVRRGQQGQLKWIVNYILAATSHAFIGLKGQSLQLTTVSPLSSGRLGGAMAQLDCI